MAAKPQRRALAGVPPDSPPLGVGSLLDRILCQLNRTWEFRSFNCLTSTSVSSGRSENRGRFGGDSVGLDAFGRIFESRNSPKPFGFSHLAVDPRRVKSPVLDQLSYRPRENNNQSGGEWLAVGYPLPLDSAWSTFGDDSGVIVTPTRVNRSGQTAPGFSSGANF